LKNCITKVKKNCLRLGGGTGEQSVLAGRRDLDKGLAGVQGYGMAMGYHIGSDRTCGAQHISHSWSCHWACKEPNRIESMGDGSFWTSSSRIFLPFSGIIFMFAAPASKQLIKSSG